MKTPLPFLRDGISSLRIFLGLWVMFGYLSSCSPTSPIFCPSPCPSLVSHPVIVSGPIRTDSTIWNFGQDSIQETLHFDVTDYADTTSIRLEAEMYSDDKDVPCYVQLYNLTDQRPIAGSNLNNLDQTRDTSENLLSAFPPYEIELALRIRSGRSGTFVYTGIENALLIDERGQ